MKATIQRMKKYIKMLGTSLVAAGLSIILCLSLTIVLILQAITSPFMFVYNKCIKAVDRWQAE